LTPLPHAGKCLLSFIAAGPCCIVIMPPLARKPLSASPLPGPIAFATPPAPPALPSIQCSSPLHQPPLSRFKLADEEDEDDEAWR
jgi:hypothetical protein